MEEATFYRTNNVPVTMGGDFTYQDAFMWFDNLDKLITHANLKAAKSGLKVKLFYSTPACYLKAVKDANPTLPIKQDDFFPYASDSTAYWTGYFTSRPTTKFMEREGNNYLQTFKMLQVLADLPKTNAFVLNELKSAMGVMQHHDAITGTEKQHVAHDYERIMARAVGDALLIGRQAFNKIMQTEAALQYERCEFNQSQCFVTEESDAFVLTVYNNQAVAKKSVIVELPVVSATYTVHDKTGNIIPSELQKLSADYFSIPSRTSKATHTLNFLINDLLALGFESFYVKRENKKVKRDVLKDYDGKLKRDQINEVIKKDERVNFNVYEMNMLSDDPMVVEQPEDIVLQNEFISLSINKKTGWINYTSKTDGTSLLYHPTPGYYIGSSGNNCRPKYRSSGAYILRPNITSSPDLITFKNIIVTDLIQSAIKQEVTLRYDDAVTLKIGLNSETTYFSSILSIEEGREHVLRFSTDIQSDGAFYTDANGRQMLKRIRNARPQWNLTLEEPVPGNYYPVVNEIYIEDDDLRFILNVDRARGGSSLKDGSLEIMQHRRLRTDDSFGVGEALNETSGGKGLYSIDTIHMQIIPKDKNNIKKAAEISNSLFSPPQLFVANATNLSLDDFKRYKTSHSFLKSQLPTGLHLLTIEPWSSNTILLRFENYLDKNISPDFISVDLSMIFTSIEILSIKETTLAGNLWLSDFKQSKWTTEGEFSESFNKQYSKEDVHVESATDFEKLVDGTNEIKLRPKQIRTFKARYNFIG